ncbi:acetylornithine deacetylase [Martelella alba]|uniref:Acetylornithine deacetylase n=1 Tax=Martelella alba TaxID=2590451 RepID=A0A506U5K1_9HYPH|nr:acetylornithine deacetylase [Martelella alba]TPW27217.1 acetylornithine deacetylase [Martelella alba]
MTSTTLNHLEKLIGFPSVCTAANYTDIADYIIDHLTGIGFCCHRLSDPSGTRAGVFATSHPESAGGVMLSAHLDVVPVDGQPWRFAPFAVTERDGRLYGRGSCDMKGFAAAALAAADKASGMILHQPLKLAFSYDEELGCIGIANMIDELDATIGKPAICIVGEPTRMQPVIGHKGKTSYRVTFKGMAGHSASAPKFLNALHPAGDFLTILQQVQADLEQHGAQDAAYGIPFSTVHAGLFSGGTALNIVPDKAVMEFEIRHLAGEKPEDILARIAAAAGKLEEKYRSQFGQCSIVITNTNAYPGFDAKPDDPAVEMVAATGGKGTCGKVDFGTEAGFFQSAGIATVVCGPGDMAQGHKADEFVELSQLEACDAMLAGVLQRLAAGHS